MNPYAAPQAELRELEPKAVSENRPRVQASILRNAMRLTLGVNLIFIIVIIAGVVIAGLIEKKWNMTFESATAGILFCTLVCWPIGILCGVLATFWDYLLQVWGWRTYETPPSETVFVVAEYADTTMQKNPYVKK